MSQKNFDNNLVAIHKSKAGYMGICILELSKVLMQEFHYDYMKNKHDNKSKLLFRNIDSLMYEINTEDIYEDFSSDVSN